MLHGLSTALVNSLSESGNDEDASKINQELNTRLRTTNGEYCRLDSGHSKPVFNWPLIYRSFFNQFLNDRILELTQEDLGMLLPWVRGDLSEIKRALQIKPLQSPMIFCHAVMLLPPEAQKSLIHDHLQRIKDLSDRCCVLNVMWRHLNEPSTKAYLFSRLTAIASRHPSVVAQRLGHHDQLMETFVQQEVTSNPARCYVLMKAFIKDDHLFTKVVPFFIPKFGAMLGVLPPAQRAELLLTKKHGKNLFTLLYDQHPAVALPLIHLMEDLPMKVRAQLFSLPRLELNGPLTSTTQQLMTGLKLS